MKLLLDAGHGGRDPGAGVYDYNECDITLDTTIKIRDMCMIEHDEWEVVLTRESDVYISPDGRRRMCLNLKPTAFVSIHCNAAQSTAANGCETFYRDDKGRPLADTIQESIVATFDITDRGTKNDEVDLGRKLAVLSTPGIPSVLVETGFITNSRDRAIISSTEMMARAILRGIEKWYEEFGG